jgi:hypothetical protein
MVLAPVTTTVYRAAMARPPWCKAGAIVATVAIVSAYFICLYFLHPDIRVYNYRHCRQIVAAATVAASASPQVATLTVAII